MVSIGPQPSRCCAKKVFALLCPIKWASEDRRRRSFRTTSRTWPQTRESFSRHWAFPKPPSSAIQWAAWSRRDLDFYPDVTEKLVLYNQIGMTDARLERPPASVD